MSNEPTQFKVKEGTHYALATLTPEQAAGFGCEGATHILTGRHGHIVGTLTVLSDRLVTVPTWSTRKGYRARFTPAVVESPDNILPGHAVIA